MNILKPAVKLLPVFLLAMTVPNQAAAYEYRSCFGQPTKWLWANPTIHVDERTFPSSSYESALEQVVDDLNDNPSNFAFNLSFGDTSVSLGNNQNEFWFTDDSSILNGAGAGVLPWVVCRSSWWGLQNEITEMDVVFSEGIPWTPSTRKSQLSNYSGSNSSFRTTTMHELGHAAGLQHENGTYNIMGSDKSHIHANGSSARAYFGEDASNGLVFLYGTQWYAGQDVGVVHWRRSGTIGEYSRHSRTRMFNTSNYLLFNYTDTDGEPRYQVSSGQQVKVEFSYENNGKDRQRTVEVGFYISTNNFITTFDRRVAGTTLDLGRNTVYTRRHTIPIPSDLSPGKYHVGVIVDENNIIGEFRENNNATYIGIEVLLRPVIPPRV